VIYIGKQTLTAEEAINLFEGGLYEMLQKEFVNIEDNIQRNKKEAAELRTIHKRYSEAGVKPLVVYTKSYEARVKMLDKMIAEGTTFDEGTLKKYGRGK
jgi:hypothetical protein